MTKKFEGFSGKIYKCPAGKRTIGYGFNIDDPVIAKNVPESIRTGYETLSPAHADYIFDIVYGIAIKDATQFLSPHFDELNIPRREAVIDMAYNLGFSRLSKFVKFREALIKKDWPLASQEMILSRWFHQVKDRAEKLRNIIINASTKNV